MVSYLETTLFVRSTDSSVGRGLDSGSQGSYKTNKKTLPGQFKPPVDSVPVRCAHSFAFNSAFISLECYTTGTRSKIFNEIVLKDSHLLNNVT